MRRRSHVTSVTAAGWLDLVAELDRWQEAGRAATLWWRDDDAVEPSARLDRLVAIAGKVPVALAVIPAAAKPELADWLTRQVASMPGKCLAVLQHGWRHTSHAAGGKKSEFSSERRREDVAVDLAAGLSSLSELFGAHALPVLVPPWNRFDDTFLPVLRDCGIGAISRATPRRAAQPACGLTEVNVHVDLVAWNSHRGFIGEEAALGGIVRHLNARRLGLVSAEEPTGILTHHLVQDEATEAFLLKLFAATGAHAAARWVHAAAMFAPIRSDQA